jgi:hypothetical protein
MSSFSSAIDPIDFTTVSLGMMLDALAASPPGSTVTTGVSSGTLVAVVPGPVVGAGLPGLMGCRRVPAPASRGEVRTLASRDRTLHAPACEAAGMACASAPL